MNLSQTVLRTVAVAIFALLWCGIASAGPAAAVPELDPGTASGGIALAAVATILVIERYRSRGSAERSELSPTILRTLTVATLALACSGTAFAGGPVPELDPGTASSGIALIAVAGVLLVERYRRR
jgi:hypothetical protein